MKYETSGELKVEFKGRGLRIVLDSGEVIPDDPGAGTPVMVEAGDSSATYWCAKETGELDCGEVLLTPAQIEWLERMEDEVNEWLEYWTKEHRDTANND
jgi:hypothetical protein